MVLFFVIQRSITKILPFGSIIDALSKIKAHKKGITKRKMFSTFFASSLKKHCPNGYSFTIPLIFAFFVDCGEGEDFRKRW